MKHTISAVLATFVLLAQSALALAAEEPTFTLSKGDVIKSVITTDAAGQTTLVVTFSPERRKQFNSFTELNLNRKVKFVCNGELICEPNIRQAVMGSAMEITGKTLPEAASISEFVLANLAPHEVEVEEQALAGQDAALEQAIRHDPLQSQLVSDLQVALDTHDKAAFEKCLNLAGISDELRKGFAQLEDEIFALPSYYVLAKNRIDEGKAHATKDGKNYTLNGDWTFDIGIYSSKSLTKGYVLPAGVANGKCLVLLTVQEKATP